MYGHIAKYCRQDSVVCGHCGEDGHEMKDCCKRQEPGICILCKRAKKPHSHPIYDRACPAYQFALDRSVGRIDYGSV